MRNRLAVLLAVTVMATAMPGSAIAAPVDGQTTEVSAKAGTEKAEKKEQIRVIQHYGIRNWRKVLLPGQQRLRDMKLPDKRSARGYKEKDSKKQRISRISKMLHGKQTIKRILQQGEVYAFTAQITDDYKLAKDVVLPKLTIEIT
ncbi:MAG: hypothetical protein ACLTTO_15420 [Lachnospiraceae bacterium]